MFDENGRVERNRDYKHQGAVPFPHDHNWEWNGKEAFRGREHLIPDYDNYN